MTSMPPRGAFATGAKRIVSVGGDLTEIAFALGLGERIVAVDTTSNWPEATQKLPKVGYMRALTPEGVLSLAPDLILLAHGAGPKAAIDRLRSSGIDVALGPAGDSAEDVREKITFVGAALGRVPEAEQLAIGYEKRMAMVQDRVATLPNRPSVLFLLSAGNAGLLTGGTGTSADSMISLAHGRNAIEGIDGYKPVSAEAVLAASPDVILVPQHTVRALGGVEQILNRPEMSATPAGKNKNIIVMDGLRLLGFGPRTPDAVLELARALHPDHSDQLVM